MRFAPFATAFMVALLFVLPAEPCSRVLWNDNGKYVVVGRNMDWFEDMHSNIWVLPRGMKRDGLGEKNPLTWTSKYGSVSITGYECITADGVNEKGLAVHMLYLPETSCSRRNEKVPGLCISAWVQYYLDNFATVDEAVKALKTQPYQLLMAVEPSSKKEVAVHLALDDKTGDSAVLECVGGKIHVYHNRDYVAITNQPTYDKQLENLKQYDGFGGKKPLPGTIAPIDRFVRGAYYVKHLPEPKNQRDAVAAIMSVMRNVSAPFGISDPGKPNVAPTIWRTVTDLTDGVLFYDGVYSPQVFWLNVNKLNFDAAEPVRKLTVDGNFELSGDAEGKLKKAEMFRFLGPN